MERVVPMGFIMMLAGVFAVAAIATIAVFLLKQRKLRRLENPKKDYYRKRG